MIQTVSMICVYGDPSHRYLFILGYTVHSTTSLVSPKEEKSMLQQIIPLEQLILTYNRGDFKSLRAQP